MMKHTLVTRPQAGKAPRALQEDLKVRLELVYDWYGLNLSSPLPEIASIWDLERLSEFTHHENLCPLIQTSLEHYESCLVKETGGALALDSERLGAPSSIAHSACLILAFLHGPSPIPRATIEGLASGILRQQRSDGSYQVYFSQLEAQAENEEKKERGGFGISLIDRTQRLDVTSRAASALMKAVENDLECY